MRCYYGSLDWLEVLGALTVVAKSPRQSQRHRERHQAINFSLSIYPNHSALLHSARRLSRTDRRSKVAAPVSSTQSD